MDTQYVTDDTGKKIAVILPIDEYEHMIEELEELEDIKQFDIAKKGKQEFIDADQAFEDIDTMRS